MKPVHRTVDHGVIISGLGRACRVSIRVPWVSMHGVLLTGRPDLEVNCRLVDAAKTRGHTLRVLDGCRAVARLGTRPSVGDEKGRPVEIPDLVVPRIGNWRPESLLGVLEVFERLGAWTPNGAEAIRTARDHWRTLRRLETAGLSIPAAVAGSDPETLAAAAHDLGYPVVVKQRRSRQGIGVVLCASEDHLQAVLDSLWRLGDEVLVQEFVGSGCETDRLLVVSGTVIAAARFRSRKGEWRSNAARGGTKTPHATSSEERRLAVEAAAAIGLGLCGIDLAWTENGPVVLDVNPSPGILHLQEACPFDVAGGIIDALLPSDPATRPGTGAE